MGLSSTPASERVHIGFFGKRNAGKSSVINAVTGQNLSIVSDVKGTTTDPVLKTMELLPIGPVVIIDTPGLDDVGELGSLRIQKTLDVLKKTDIAVLVVDALEGFTKEDENILKLIKDKNLPYVICYNKCDLKEIAEKEENTICVSALANKNINELKELIAGKIKQEPQKKIVADILNSGDMAVLVVPIDEGAPKGRLILPQQQTIRDLLDNGMTCTVTQLEQLTDTLALLGDKAKIVITDSQAFGKVSKMVPDHIPLTSFSILFMRYKGELSYALEGAKMLDELKDGDTVLISEGCTHHRQCGDIGTVKMPNWIKDYTKKDLNFEFTSGTEFPDDLSRFSIVVHCGGCMLNSAEMQNRIKTAVGMAVPMTNYGMAISYMNGILKRTVKPFGIEL
ncbi:MAG: [FeFe] hydrogenase H-cluster maturation GTPase HydF [Ruminococcaceae bacterium]|nr:[FeFe] hydrogenase H-cluster maturation GTPase HydF [Oscillospiraceae bacterium]